jgi:hypothetical protein
MAPALLFGLALVTAAVAPVAMPSLEERSTEARSIARGVEADAAPHVGDQLQATKDVELDEATIAEGSKVSVSGVRRASGRVLLDVALADGHVVRNVPLATIAQSFRRIDG